MPPRRQNLPRQRAVRDVEMEELHQQIQRLQERLEANNESSSSIERVCHRHPQQNVAPKSTDLGIKIDIPDFEGCLQQDEFIDWLHTVERVFELKDILDDKHVKLVAIKLKKHASIWWENLKRSREREGCSKIRTLEKMCRELTRKFLPDRYYQDNFVKFHNLQQKSLTVEEYTMEFEQLMMKCDVREKEEQTIARYLGGLDYDISKIVQLQQYWTSNDVIRLALRVEKQISKKNIIIASKPHDFEGSQRTQASNIVAETPAKVEKEASSSYPAQPNTRKCFKCQGFGHITSDCPNRRIITIIGEEIHEVSNGEVEKEHSDETKPQLEEELIAVDHGESLVVRRSPHATITKDEDWLQHNIFHTRCPSRGKVCNVIIDSGSCENVVSSYMVEKLGLPVKDISHPYKLQWLQKGNEQFDRKAIHDGHTNTYLFVKDGVQIKLTPLKPKDLLEKKDEDKALISRSTFQKLHHELRITCLLLLSKVNDATSPFPEEIRSLLEEFSDVVPDEIPHGLPIIRIDLKLEDEFSLTRGECTRKNAASMQKLRYSTTNYNRPVQLCQNGHNGSVVWASNSKKEAQNPVLQLLDSGNLVLQDRNAGILWQSFDYPTDTLLADMKLGWDFKSGLNRQLSAWKTPNDPCPGDLTLGIEPYGNPDFVLWKGLRKYAQTGPWNGIVMSGTPQLKPNSWFTFSLVSNAEEVYYIFYLRNKSTITKVIVNQTSSRRERYLWNKDTQTWEGYGFFPWDVCDNYGTCGAYGTCVNTVLPPCKCLKGFKLKSQESSVDWFQGCERNKPLDCQKGDGFIKFGGLKLPDTTHSWVNKSMNLKECRAKCLENCSCTAYSTLDIKEGSGCAIWFGDLIDLKDLQSDGQDLYIRMAFSDSDHEETKGTTKMMAGLIIATAILVVVGVLVITYYIRRSHRNIEARENGSSDERQIEDVELPSFELDLISNATSNFSSNNKLGEGGFGPVYKGTLPDGKEIAVKRLSRSSGQGIAEFRNEVALIAKLQHRNLVKLLGCCIQGEEKMLIYEYMPNKSLDFFIFGSAECCINRMNILCDRPYKKESIRLAKAFSHYLWNC
ncbi:hypothetical protein SLEP1_g57184 [Rubroshorea leprosula]|uniref:non-specific serine/threonine protein kinase n=1 Tax=Rubroshorea leprosula TaxID=152421 RepID=A0AAV5MPG5_9ROSI|nr:hypothetical protein SLEP1_g57184 [Rubroshorea leprosula]